MSGEVGVKVEVGGCQAVEDHAQSNHERKKEHFLRKADLLMRPSIEKFAEVMDIFCKGDGDCHPVSWH